MSAPVAVTVGSTPTLLAVVPPAGQILIENTGAATVFVGIGPDTLHPNLLALTTASGIELAGGAPGGTCSSTSTEFNSESWYAIVATGSGTVIVETIP